MPHRIFSEDPAIDLVRKIVDLTSESSQNFWLGGMVAHQEVLRRSRDEPDGLLDSDTELFIVSLSGDGPLQLVTRCTRERDPIRGGARGRLLS